MDTPRYLHESFVESAHSDKGDALGPRPLLVGTKPRIICRRLCKDTHMVQIKYVQTKSGWHILWTHNNYTIQSASRGCYEDVHGHHYLFSLRCLRLEACYAIFCHLDLQMTNQLQAVEGSTYKTGVKGPSE